MEVLVVDDGSSDGSGRRIAEYLSSRPRPTWRLLEQERNQGKAAACNRGIMSSQAPLILFTDDDCVVQRDWAEMHMKCHSEASDSAAFLGAVAFPDEWITRSNFVRYYNSRYVGNRSVRSIGGDTGHLPPRLFAGINTSVSRKHLLEVGLFDSRVGRGQDGELAYRLSRAGVRLAFDPRPRVVHHSPEMASLSLWLSKFVKAYKESVPLLNELHPGFVESTGHWFLERPQFRAESAKRDLVRIALRAACSPPLARTIQRILERTDGAPICYAPLLFRYAITGACLATVKARERRERGEKRRSAGDGAAPER
jgi:GT2 family glycosyltransferase